MLLYSFDKILKKLGDLAVCSDLEMRDGDEARKVINELLPSIRSLKREMEKKDKRISDYGWAAEASRQSWVESESERCSWKQIESTDVKIPPWDSLETHREVSFCQGYVALT